MRQAATSTRNGQRNGRLSTEAQQRKAALWIELKQLARQAQKTADRLEQDLIDAIGDGALLLDDGRSVAVVYSTTTKPAPKRSAE